MSAADAWMAVVRFRKPVSIFTDGDRFPNGYMAATTHVRDPGSPSLRDGMRYHFGDVPREGEDEETFKRRLAACLFLAIAREIDASVVLPEEVLPEDADMTLDFDRLDACVERALHDHTCARLMPGELRELVRLARLGEAVEAAAQTEVAT